MTENRVAQRLGFLGRMTTPAFVAVCALSSFLGGLIMWFLANVIAAFVFRFQITSESGVFLLSLCPFVCGAVLTVFFLRRGRSASFVSLDSALQQPPPMTGASMKVVKVFVVLGLLVVGYLIFTNNVKQADHAILSATQINNVNINDSMHFKNNIDVAVTSVTTSNSVGGLYMRQNVSDGGVYVIAKYKIMNLGTEPMPAGKHFFLLLVDGKGTEYKPDVGATIYAATVANNNNKVLSELNPGLSVTDTEVFEVAKAQYTPATWGLLVNDGYRVRIQ